MSSAASELHTVREWLASIAPPPPPALADRLNDLLRNDLHRSLDELPDICLDAGETLLEQLLESGSTSRETALDLLTVDALVTYAFEIAAVDAPHFMERAASAMNRIASIPDTLSQRTP